MEKSPDSLGGLMKGSLTVLQLISSTGYYGAERWIIALDQGIDVGKVKLELAVTSEDPSMQLEVLDNFSGKECEKHRIEMANPFDIRAVRRLVDIIKQRNVDIVHSHGYKSDIIALAACKMAGKPCISTPHGFGESIGIKLKAYFWLGNFALRFFDLIAPLSEELFRLLESKGVSSKKMVTIQNSVDLQTIDAFVAQLPSRKLAGKPTLTLGYTGRLVKGKQIDHILEVFSELRSANRSIELHIAGDGPLKSELTDLAIDLGCADSVTFLGYMPNGLQPTSEFDIFLMTSRSEGIPRCLMEAHALRVPIVAYAIPGVTDLIEHNVSGMLAPLDDKRSLKLSCEKLIEDAELRRTLGHKGRELVENEFSATRMASQYVEAYRKITTADSSDAVI